MPIFLETWWNSSVASGTTAPGERYYRSGRYYRSRRVVLPLGAVLPWVITVLPLSRGGLNRRGTGQISPYPYSVSSPLFSQQKVPLVAPTPACRLRAILRSFLRWNRSPPSRVPWIPVLPLVLRSLALFPSSLAVRAMHVDLLGLWLFLGTLRTWQDC